MKPMGRKKFKATDCKHKVKDNGKHIEGWWEGLIPPCKKRDRQQARHDIHLEITKP